MNYLLLKLLIPRDVVSLEDGRFFLHRYLRAFPLHIPEKCGQYEPLAHVFDEWDLNHVLQVWGPGGFIAERKKHPTALIDISPALSSPYTPYRYINCILQVKQIKKEDFSTLRDFVYEVSNEFRAVYAAAHISTPEEAVFAATQKLKYFQMNPEAAKVSAQTIKELEEIARLRTPFTSQLNQIKTKQLRKHIPNIFWLTVFGLPYVELFGVDRIITAPSYEVRQLSYGGIGLQLSEVIEDTPLGWQNVLALKKRVKLHLNTNAIYDPALPKDHVYNAPDFGIPKEVPGERKRVVLTLARGEATNRALMDLLSKKKIE